MTSKPLKRPLQADSSLIDAQGPKIRTDNTEYGLDEGDILDIRKID